MALWIFLGLQLAATGFGFAYLWRRQRRLGLEIQRLRQALTAVQASKLRRAMPAVDGAAALADVGPPLPIGTNPTESPQARAAKAWRLTDAASAFKVPSIAPDTARGLALGALATAPALGFVVGLESAAMIASGLAATAVMMLVGLRPDWRVAAWTGLITGVAWALAGFALGISAPILVMTFMGVAGVNGLAHAARQPALPGSALALAMATAALAHATQTGMVGPAGGAFAFIVASAAIVGATSLRLESIHLAAFGATLVGLFVLSGQPNAAIWFTPAAVLAGALFFAIAVVRVPGLGARGLTLAGSGAFAPMLAIAALHWSQHGLADPGAAAAALAALGCLIIGLIALSASRRPNGLAALRYTLWTMAIAALIAFISAIHLALPAPLAAPAFAVLAVALSALNGDLRHRAWQALVCALALASALSCFSAAQMLLGETPDWNPWVVIGSSFAATALLAAAGAHLAQRADSSTSASALEALAIACVTAGASLGLRLFFSGGATLLQPVGFVEAGAHISAWLTVALGCAWRAHRGAGGVRAAAATLLGLIAIAMSALAGLLWLSPYWIARQVSGAPVDFPPLGFLLPALLFWSHWVFWRARGAERPTRVALAAAALTSAGFIALSISAAPNMPPWAIGLVSATAFALAVLVNFAPGVTAGAPRRIRRRRRVPS